jgi:hypothetical protein
MRIREEVYAQAAVIIREGGIRSEIEKREREREREREGGKRYGARGARDHHTVRGPTYERTTRSRRGYAPKERRERTHNQRGVEAQRERREGKREGQRKGGSERAKWKDEKRNQFNVIEDEQCYIEEGSHTVPAASGRPNLKKYFSNKIFREGEFVNASPVPRLWQ